MSEREISNMKPSTRRKRVDTNNDNESKSKNNNLYSFMTLTVLTILCSSVGWSIMYRLNWDLGEILFPTSVYPYYVQSFAMIAIFSVVFVILMVILFKTYKKMGKDVEYLS